MAYKAIVSNLRYSGDHVNFDVDYYTTSNGPYTIDSQPLSASWNDFPDITIDNIKTVIQNSVLSYASGQSYTMTSADVILPMTSIISDSLFTTIQSVTTPWSFNYTPGRSIVTGTGATGFQVSSTRNATVTYSTKITTTATIAGGQEGYVVLEIAPTNSATAGDWKEIGRVTNGQALSLALTLQSVQPVSGILMGIVPVGYYVKVRSVNVTGTPAYSMVSGQEVLL